jgi:D-3-phosphoglycerate dehydrogenase
VQGRLNYQEGPQKGFNIVPNVLITTVPFAENNPVPIDLLKAAGINYEINPLGRKLTESELVSMVPGYDAIIAGTEPLTGKVLAEADSLKVIARVGIGLDSVDLDAAAERGIHVCYTPDAPAPAVAELTIGLMLGILRSFCQSDRLMRQGAWKRFFGYRISEVTIGIMGLGRIGSRVLNFLEGMGAQRVLLNDIDKSIKLNTSLDVKWVDKHILYSESDLLTLHVPLTKETCNLLTKKDLLLMKKNAFLVNTARGGIVNEKDLYEVMKAGHLAGAALDVFEQEPYQGNLREIERCILTSHMGSMSQDCRERMEIEATQEVVNFFSGKPFKNLVT